MRQHEDMQDDMGKRSLRLKLGAFILIWVCLYTDGLSQIGGRYAYELLNQPQAARLTALGGILHGVYDDDVTMASSNPASLDSLSDQSIALSHNFHFTDIGHGYGGYGHYVEKYKIMTHVAFAYQTFGDFVLADEFGNQQGTFSGRENAIMVGASKQLNEKIRVGANIKGVFGKYESFGSSGLAVDLGLNYDYIPGKTTFSFVVKNLGGELSTFRDKRKSAPLDIQIGITNRLKYLPFRFSIIAHQLQQWNIRYDDPDLRQDLNILGQENEENRFSNAVDNFFRHFIFNGEFLLGRKENLRLRIGYNHQRRRELSLNDFRSLAGFSLGFGLKIKQFRLDYGVAFYHRAGGVNHFTIATNLDWFR